MRKREAIKIIELAAEWGKKKRIEAVVFFPHYDVRISLHAESIIQL